MMAFPIERIGSIPRPPSLIEAGHGSGTGSIPRAELLSKQDFAIQGSVAPFEPPGSKVVSDGWGQGRLNARSAGSVLRGGDNATESAKSRNNSPAEASIPGLTASLESILCTEELRRRPRRPLNYEKENRALVALAGAMADSQPNILQTMEAAYWRRDATRFRCPRRRARSQLSAFVAPEQFLRELRQQRAEQRAPLARSSFLNRRQSRCTVSLAVKRTA
jgi:hypothetical protein